MRFYIEAQIGPNREILKGSGFLHCKNVPIARTGQQIYGPEETPIAVGSDGRAIIEREAEEVFRPETMASFNGAPLTNNHPEEDVTALNWKELALGTVFNVRRGEGVDSEFLLADILVTDVEAIRLILEDDKVELSCGYDAKYEETGVGTGRQVQIVGNHVALVEAGRCGWQCAVKDSAAQILGGSMAKQTIKIVGGGWQKTKDSIVSRILALGTKDEAGIKRVLDEAEVEEKKEKTEDGEEGDNHIHIHAGESTSDAVAMDARFAAYDEKLDAIKDSIAELVKDKKSKDAEEEEKKDKETKDAEAEEEEKKKTEDDMEEEAPTGTGDEARKATDSAFLEDSFQTTISNAEILAPGVSFPAYDSAAKPKSTLDTLTAFRKKVIGISNSTVAGAVVITELRANRALTLDALSKMSTAETRTLFNGAAMAMKQRNAAAVVAVVRDSTKVQPLDVNERNRQFWEDQKNGGKKK